MTRPHFVPNIVKVSVLLRFFCRAIKSNHTKFCNTLLSFIRKIKEPFVKKSYKDICLLSLVLTKRIGGKCTPFNISKHGRLSVSSNKVFSSLSVKFVVASIFHVCFYTEKIGISIYSLKIDGYKYHCNSDNFIADCLTQLYVIGCSLSALIHISRKLHPLCTLINFLNNLDDTVGVQKLESNLVKFILLQGPFLTIVCSTIYGAVKIVRFGSHLNGIESKWYILYNLIYDAYDWWDFTWVVSLDLMVGFSGLFLSYTSVYICTINCLR